MGDRIESGIPDRYTDLSKHFKVMPVRPPRDGDFNEVIQKKGVHFLPGNDPDYDAFYGPGSWAEVQWYLKHRKAEHLGVDGRTTVGE